MAPIHDAAKEGDLQKVKDIADADPSAVHARGTVRCPRDGRRHAPLPRLPALSCWRWRCLSLRARPGTLPHSRAPQAGGTLAVRSLELAGRREHGRRRERRAAAGRTAWVAKRR